MGVEYGKFRSISDTYKVTIYYTKSNVIFDVPFIFEKRNFLD